MRQRPWGTMMNSIVDIYQTVTVIIPVHNRMEFLIDALESVYQQQYRPIEVKVVDDGSAMESKTKLYAIVRKFQNRDAMIAVELLTNPSKGAPAARNTGFRQSTGAYIQFLDSDDLLLPDKLREQVQELNSNPQVHLVYSKAQYTDENLNRLNKYWGRKLDGSSMDYFLFSWQTMCPLYRRDTVLKYGLWDESLKINQDWELSVRYIINGVNALFIDKVHCLFRTHSKGNIGSFEKDLNKVLSKWDSTQKVYRLLQSKGKLDGALKKAFFKRWTYILLITSGLNAKKEFHKQLNEIKPEISQSAHLLLQVFSTRLFATAALKVLGYKAA